MKRFKMTVASYLILIAKGKVLLSRRFQTGYMDGYYSLPAGHVDEGETLEDCLVREFYEEIGIRIKKKEIELVHMMHRQEKDTRLDFFYTTKNYTGKIKNTEPEKCDDLKWFKLNQLPSNVAPYIKQAIENSIKKILYSDIGF